MRPNSEFSFIACATFLCFFCPCLTLTDEKHRIRKCYDDVLKANSNIKNRFADELIMTHCKGHMKWNREFLDSLARSTSKAAYKPKNLTPAQWDWISEVWRCKDSVCMCHMIESCKKLMLTFRPNESIALNTSSTLKGGEISRTKRQRGWQNINDMINERAGKVTRKEIRALTDDERSKYHRALNRLKVELVDGISKYDLIIKHHTPEYSPEAHYCASFLPFHRELLKGFEVSLRTIESSMGIPYWDTTLDEPLPDPRDSIVWSDLFFGNGYGDVVEGPFSNWTTVYDVRVGQLSRYWKITRNLGVMPFSGLVRQSDIDELMRRNSYFRDFVYCVNPFFELVHGGAHLWIGGHMVELRVAPNDPIFFVYHSFIDLIWEEWRQVKQSRYQRETEYVNNNEACNAVCQGDQQMRPFPINMLEGLSNAYTDNMYQYAPRPSCSYQDPDCRSSFLFCDTRRYRCMSKVKMRGNCRGYEGTDICYQGQCQWGRCAPLPTTTTTTTTTTTLPPPPETAWLPITVLSLTEKRSLAAYAPAYITSMDRWTGRRLTGRAADPTQSSYYTGAAFAQIINPAASNNLVEANLEVQDPATGNQCQSMCLLNSDLGYENCEPKLRLSQITDNQVATSIEAASSLLWRGQQRIPTKFLFICNPLSLDLNVPIKTLPPPPTTTPVPIKPIQNRNPNCLNTHRCCSIWTAAPRQCVTNRWLVKACPKSCNVCDSGTTPEEDEHCSDYHRQCPQWAAGNQCTSNSYWMEENCRRSCNVCERPRMTLEELCGTGPKERDKPRCRDQNSDCEAWASLGECQRNPRWMHQSCPKSCNIC